MEDYKKLLTDLYTIHDPDRIKQIDYFLEKYKGKEKQFYISQKAKYKNKKPVSESQKIIEEAMARIKSKSATKPNVEEDIIRKPEVTTGNETSPPQQTKDTPPVTEKEIIPENQREDILFSEDKTKQTTPFWKSQKPSETIAEVEKEAASLSTESAKTDAWFNEERKSANPKPQQPSRRFYRENDKHFNQKYFLYIFGMVLLVIIFTVIIFFIFFYNPRIKQIKPDEEPKTTIEKEEPKEDPKTTTIATKPSIDDKAETVSPKPIKTPRPIVTQQKPTTTAKSGARITKGDLLLPAYFVACYAVKTENHALKKVSDLKAKGFEASYYWIPDFVPQGNTYFKIVIGPYASRIDAMRKLTPVQERAEFDAYVLELK